MRSVETEGGSIDEAIERALAALRAQREQVEIEILENATKGLFGLGSRRARVRATMRQSLDARLGNAGPDRVAGVSRETSAPAADSAAHKSREATATRARDILQALLGYLDDAPRVEDRPTEDGATIGFSITGTDSGMIIGRRGQTLDALEHLVSRIVFRDDGDLRLRIALDVEGYRERREESLRDLAARLASKARETGRVVTLNPMSPRDRRIVHLALQSHPAVST